MECPDCGSNRTRRGGWLIWTVYVVLLAATVPAVLLFKLNAALAAGVLVAAFAVTHLLVNQRVCLACGAQWRAG